MEASPQRQPYWSERHGRGPLSVPLDLPGAKRLFISVYRDLLYKDCFQEAFGYECVDAGQIDGTLGFDPGAWFLAEVGRENIWPIDEHIDGWDEDTFLDAVEALHDLCSQGVDGSHHDYNNCGWHYSVFDQEEGRAHYRRRVNPILARLERPLELGEDGRLRAAVPTEFTPLLKAKVPQSVDPDRIGSRVADAVELFRARSSTRGDRRRAVRELADVLEAVRSDLKAEMLPADERALFEIANKFSIRHNDKAQLYRYDSTIWMTWIFYLYLATIHAILRVRERDQR